MTFFILLAGLFLLIQLKRPFRKKMFGYVFLAVYLTVLALYTINSLLFTSYLTAFCRSWQRLLWRLSLPAF
ncbi:hypothetical protein P9D28_17255 [Bacillus haynesii]|uniref:hypothetical protein n=1 Tax=Bacillus haynesii TaxID=1925021 RepID=UPI002DB811FC|nr:hypothetical protein [Bacillus haynesii]MEC1554159.1 hypothetical protein [Bacillus haynesii]